MSICEEYGGFKAPNKIVADGILNFYSYCLEKKNLLLQTDNSHEMSSIIFSEK